MDRPLEVRQLERLAPAIYCSWQVVMCMCLLIVSSAAASRSRPDVLVLHSYHKAYWCDSMQAGIESVLGDEEQTNYFIEYMDTKKIKTDSYLDGLYSLYQQKYQNRQFDVVITTDDNAYGFARRHHTALFKDRPLVFCGVSDFDPASIAGRPVTGVLEKVPYADVLAAAAAICPQAEKVYFICDYTTTAQIHLKWFTRVMQQQYANMDIVLLRDVTVEQMTEALQSAEPNSFIVNIAWWYDVNERAVLQTELADILKQAKRPVFTFTEWLVTRGATGGKCISPKYQGKLAGQLAQKILNGQSPQSLPVIEDPHETTVFLFDTALLERYQIPESTIPKGTVRLNQTAHFKMISQKSWRVIKFGSIILLLLVGLLLLFESYRQKVHRIVRESEERYRGLVETSSDWIWELDTDGRSTFDSPQVENATGYRPDELLGKKAFDFMTPDEATRVMAIFNQYVAAKKPLSHFQIELTHKNGMPVVVEANGIPILNAKGHLTGYRGVNRVITERVEIERTLHAQQAEIQSIFKASPTGIGFTVNRTMMRVNDLICEMTGYSREELVGENARMLYRSDEDYEYVGAEKYRQIQECGTGTVEIPWVRKDGTQIDVLLSSTPLDIDDLGKGVTFTALDITERKAAEEQLRQRTHDLERFEKLTIGRELKMKELKQQIEKLQTGVQNTSGQNG
ncbi:MAG: ABC transporter substrate binding protein [Planctomycetota bacterium]